MYFHMEYFLSILVYLVVLLIGLNSAADEIKYEIQYDRMESFNGTDDFYKFRFDVTKKDDLKNVFIVDGSVELLQDFNDDWKLAIEVFKLNENNEYESILFIPRLGVCNFMQVIYKRYFYEKLREYSNLPHFDECPVPAGNYTITQYPMDMEIFRRFRHLITPGSYRLQNFLIQNDVAVSGVLFYGHVVEKP